MENSTVSILCYTMDGNLLAKIGLVEDGNYFSTIESGINPEDSSLLHRAKGILKEQYDIEIENEKWKYLGEVQRKKDGKPIYCYAVEVDSKITGVKMFELNKISKISDAVTQASFYRLFSLLYKKEILQ